MFATPASRKMFEDSAEIVAPTLLGHFLARLSPEGVITAGLITEVEAYLHHDPASHSYKGPGKRNAAMFGPPGRAYVYLIYGFHHCVNAVCGPEGFGEAVLIRALEPVEGVERMTHRRLGITGRAIANGPGKICQALAINRELDGADLCAPNSPLQIRLNPAREEFLAANGPIVSGPRIGITKAVELPLRFGLSRSRFLSRPFSS